MDDTDRLPVATRVNARAARLGHSPAAKAVLAVLLIGAGALGAGGLQVAENQAETTAPVVSDLCQSGQAGRVESVSPGACGTAAKVEDQGAGTVTVRGVEGPEGPEGAEGAEGVPGKVGPAGGVGPSGPVGRPGGAGGKGQQGAPGAPGQPGAPGARGADSTTPGPAGPPGADSTVPGPRGAEGPPGAPGLPGSPPASFTFTDQLGTTYTCEPSGAAGPGDAPSYRCTS